MESRAEFFAPRVPLGTTVPVRAVRMVVFIADDALGELAFRHEHADTRDRMPRGQKRDKKASEKARKIFFVEKKSKRETRDNFLL